MKKPDVGSFGYNDEAGIMDIDGVAATNDSEYHIESTSA